MLTSRNDECHQYATEKYIALDGLAEAEAQGLLLRAAHVAHDQHWALKDDAQKVASLLRSHPLALIQAGSYVARGHCTLAEYPQVYVQQRKRLLTFRPNQARSRYRDVYATFEASAEILQSSRTELSGDALQLLPVLAICGPSRLPLPLFEAAWRGAQAISLNETGTDDADRLTPWHVSRLPSFIQIDTDIWDSFRLIEAIHLLKSFSLVSTDTYNGFLSVSMHPLIHAWARDRLDPTEQHGSWVTTGCLVVVSSDDHVLWRKHGRQLQPHLQALLSWEISRMFTSEPPVMITGILVKCGMTQLFALMNNLSTYLSLNRLTVDERWLPVYYLTARNLVNYGKVREAVSLLEQVVKIQEQTLAEDHPSRLASQHGLAIAYRANGQVKEAVSLLEQVVKIREQTLAEDHPSRLASQHTLATAYQANGQVKEAVSLLEQVIKIEEQTLAEDHPDRLTSQHELAGAYRANGQVREAVSLLEQVVKIQEQTLAEDHPSRLASQHELARAYRANRQVKEAVSLLEQVVKIREQTLAEDHPDRLASQEALATIFWDLGRRNASLQIMKHVVEIQRQVLDKHHPDRKNSEAWLEYFEDEMCNVEPA
jgi:tetratricopeptide (TPR) repeat protein